MYLWVPDFFGGVAIIAALVAVALIVGLAAPLIVLVGAVGAMLAAIFAAMTP